jgi:hypothetical protein
VLVRGTPDHLPTALTLLEDLVRLGQTAEARRLLERVVAHLPSGMPAFETAGINASVACLYNVVGLHDRAAAWEDRALALLAELAYVHEQDNIREMIILNRLGTRSPRGVTGLIEQVELSPLRTDLLIIAASHLVKAGRREGALQMLMNARAVAEQINDDGRRSDAYRAMAHVLADMGQLRHGTGARQRVLLV